jgi:malonyl-CoA/methylmalonyl-CoA synthetase
MNRLFLNALNYKAKIAIISNGDSYTYDQLINESKGSAKALLGEKEDLNEARVAFMVQPGFDYVKIQWAIWQAGGIAVPICVSYPVASIEHVLDDALCSVIICDSEFKASLVPFAKSRDIPLLSSSIGISSNIDLPKVNADRSAMILYTSGTTGKPKGVVTTHSNIEAQISTLVKAWHWSEEDHILNVLPLHHVHGIINVVSCALWSGATCQFINKFEAKAVIDIFLDGKVNVFMSVPTIYYKLTSYWETLSKTEQKDIYDCMNQFRLMISGSAALPISTMEQWKKISGQTLLERYGMTEIGMAISNSYSEDRLPGFIGKPLPSVEIRLLDENGNPVKEGKTGEIQVKGANVFKEYWNNESATKAAFTPDGWFITGDVAKVENGNYKIVGRKSVDIIKSGGYKISALEIEEVLRTHPQIKDCAVLGIPDVEWDEIICASLVLDTDSIDLNSLKNWMKELLPNYKTPRKYLIQDDLPRNVMGKVTKNELKKFFTENKK